MYVYLFFSFIYIVTYFLDQIQIGGKPQYPFIIHLKFQNYASCKIFCFSVAVYACKVYYYKTQVLFLMILCSF